MMLMSSRMRQRDFIVQCVSISADDNKERRARCLFARCSLTRVPLPVKNAHRTRQLIVSQEHSLRLIGDLDSSSWTVGAGLPAGKSFRALMYDACDMFSLAMLE